MFDRVEYKKIAKRQLKGRWATPILATASLMAVVLIISAPSLVEAIKNGQFAFGGIYGFQTRFSTGTIDNFLGLVILAIIGILSLAYTKLFLDLWKTREPLPFSAFLSAFSQWGQGILASLWLYLWVFLWSLLFFIPGIVKSYAYSQMFFIVAENPKIGVRKAMKLSIEITRGYKGDLFVMDLSFFGWILLSSLTGGLLNLYVLPYMQMSKTNAYKMLKAMALRSGRVRPEDFGEAPENAGDGSGTESTDSYTTSQGAPAQAGDQMQQPAEMMQTPVSPAEMQPEATGPAQDDIPTVINLPSSYGNDSGSGNQEEE
ncbi:MAG: DUF975 family protein [Treponema sp.]|nr:DUF975 family protein [Treponema sp.]